MSFRFCQQKRPWPQVFCLADGSLSGLVPNVDFDLNNQHCLSFAQVMFKFWAFRVVDCVQNFSLKCLNSKYCNPINVEVCVRVAIERGVEQLSLQTRLEQPLVLPRTLFNCTTLVVLKLEDDILIDPPCASSIALPNLETLHLEDVKYANNESLFRLLSGCTVLRNLFIRVPYSKTNSKYKHKIIVPTLKRLHMWTQCMSYKLEINAPALEYLYFKGFMGTGILLENSFNIAEAVIDLYFPRFLIRQLYNVKSLHLSYKSTTRFRNFFSDFDATVFHNLALMKLSSVSSCVKDDILGLLEWAPNLEVLVLALADPPLFSDEERKVRWPLVVPKCLSSSLTSFHFEGFRWSEDELGLVKYILKSSRFLKKMTITSKPPDSEEKFNLLKELLMFPRHSRTCKIAFVYD